MSKEHQLASENQPLSDAAEIGKLFKTYSHLVYGLSLYYLKDKALADDAVMDVFEVLLKRPYHREVKSFRPWLMKVARNYCLKKIERCVFFNKSEELKEKHFQIMENDTDVDDENERLLQNIETSLETLNTAQQQCIGLFYYKEMSYVEVAEDTGYSLKEVKSYLQNGKEKMRRQLIKE